MLERCGNCIAHNLTGDICWHSGYCQARIATPHELGQSLDELDGLRPMAVAPPVVRVPPPFPLSAYLVIKRAE
jgi:hypothetical protein